MFRSDSSMGRVYIFGGPREDIDGFDDSGCVCDLVGSARAAEGATGTSIGLGWEGDFDDDTGGKLAKDALGVGSRCVPDGETELASGVSADRPPGVGEDGLRV